MRGRMGIITEDSNGDYIDTALRKDFFKAASIDYPLAWPKFVKWFEKNCPERYYHSDCWVEEITLENLKKFFEWHNVTTLDEDLPVMDRHLKSAFNTLENAIKLVNSGKGLPKKSKPARTVRQVTGLKGDAFELLDENSKIISTHDTALEAYQALDKSIK